MLRKYISLANVSLQNSLAYRGSLLVSFAASLLYVVAIFYLWKAIFSSRAEVGGYSWTEMKAYLLIAHASNSLLSWYTEMRISNRILDGNVAMDLLKPVDFQVARLAETLGASVVEGGITVVMMVILLFVFAGVMLPASAESSMLFCISLCLSLLIKFEIVYLFSLLCFWTSSGRGVAFARIALTRLLSGALVPLAFFPDWFEGVALALPFQGMVHTPASLYLGHLAGSSGLQAVGLQLIWVVGLWIAGRRMWNWAVRQVTIHGG